MTASTRFGPFWLDVRLAVGGTAEVYLARPVDENSDLPKRVVVKRLLPHFAQDAEGRAMFDREAHLHAAVTHDNVVTVFHAGKVETGEPYLVMEYIEGVDGYRLLRRLRQEDELLPVGVAVYLAREVLRALESVHAAPDPTRGRSLGIVHRDVSPSNIYLSSAGKVKLGDFGIARSTTRTTLRSETGQVLKGKFAYLAPEQVAGETSDHRADLFSLATVLAEILLNRPLFPGGGQLAILLAIRDCRIDALLEAKSRLPPGLLEVMQRALSRDPAARYPTAKDFADALAPFEADPRLAVRELSARVRWVQAASSSDQLAAVRDSALAKRAAKVTGSGLRSAVANVVPAATPPPPVDEDAEPKTERYDAVPSWILTPSGERRGPFTFARLMEALATGEIQRGDQLDFVGRGFQPVDKIAELERFFPAQTATTNQLTGPGAPDVQEQVTRAALLKTLASVASNRDSGVLFIEHGEADGGARRKELYFVNGKLHHVVSSNAQELLGEYLVRRGKLEREELDLALAVLPRYGGRMGDTLIAMGLVGPVDVFRAIRDQGRDRVTDLFSWNAGTMSFYRGHTPPHVEFPLDLDVPPLMLAGLEAAETDDVVMARYRPMLDRPVSPAAGVHDTVTWPEPVFALRASLTEPMLLRDVLRISRDRGQDPATTFRALDILLAAGFAVAG